MKLDFELLPRLNPHERVTEGRQVNFVWQVKYDITTRAHPENRKTLIRQIVTVTDCVEELRMELNLLHNGVQKYDECVIEDSLTANYLGMLSGVPIYKTVYAK